MRLRTGPILYVAMCGLLLAAAGCSSGNRAAAKGPPTSGREDLRTCVDRWNQDNMRRWRSLRARIAFRALAAREQSAVVIPTPARRRCVVSLAAHAGDDSWICLLASTGGYNCPLVTRDGMPPLTNANGRTDRRGRLMLDVPLAGPRSAPLLAWQRYPHVDSFVLPWSRRTLRPGLTFDHLRGPRFRGTCLRGSEQTRATGALRCVSDVQFDPCFAPGADWNRAGAVVACARVGATRFVRFVVARSS